MNIAASVLAFFLLFHVPGSGIASHNTASADSLHRALADADPAHRPTVFYKLCLHFVKVDLDSALYYADRMLQASGTIGDSLTMAKAYRTRGSIQMYLEQLEPAIADMEQGLALAQRHPSPDGNTAFFLLNDLGVAYYRLGRFGRAMGYDLQYLSKAEDRKNNRSMLFSLNNIGVVYSEITDYRSALTYYQRALRLKQGDSKKSDLSALQINIGECHAMLGNYDSALTILRRVLADCAGGGCSPSALANAYLILGKTYVQQGRYINAKRELTNGVNLAQSGNTVRSYIASLRLLATVAVKEDQPAKAIELLDKARLLAKKRGLQVDRMRNHHVYALAYEAMGSYKEATLHWKRYTQQHDNLFPKTLIHEIIHIQAKYDEKKNLNEIANQKKMLTLDEQELARSRNQALSLSAAATVALVVVLWIGWLYYHKQKAHVVTVKENIRLGCENNVLEIEIKNRTRELGEATDIVEQTNDELKHLMHKISHDIRGPVATIQGLCSLGATENKGSEAGRYFKMANDTAVVLDSILTRLHRTIEINNANLKIEEVNLLDTVKKAWGQIHESQQLHGGEGIPDNLTISYGIDQKLTVKSSEEMLSIILENLLNNTVKFRKMSQKAICFVKVSATQNEETTEIIVVDNGIGIPEEVREKVFGLFVRGTAGRTNTGGMGLYLASIAARRIGATMKLGVSEQGYTELTLRVPKKYTPNQLFFHGKKIATWMMDEENQEKET